MLLPNDEDIDDAIMHLTTLMSMNLGFDLETEDMKGTPRRMIEAWFEMTRGRFDTDERVKEVLETAFPSSYDEMIVERGLEVVGICPHHFLPIEYTVCIGYIPRPPRRLCVGLSKLARATEILAARPVMQEQWSKDLSDALDRYLRPVGSGVILTARHGCMTCRGVKQRHSEVVTASLSGIFKSDPTVRSEFLAYFHNGGHK